MNVRVSWKKCAALAALGWCLATQARSAAPAPVRVALSEQMPPVSFTEAGMTSGILLDLLKALFDGLPRYQAEFHSFPWIRARKR